jgi:hypothetical protein
VWRDRCLELASRVGRDPDEIVEWWAERAAIREHDGGESHDDAERAAFDEVRGLLEPGLLAGERRVGPQRAEPIAGTLARDRKPNV